MEGRRYERRSERRFQCPTLPYRLRSYSKWEFVPWWHWRVWLLRNWVSEPLLLRRLVWPTYSFGGDYDAWREYANVQVVARLVLEERFGNDA
jgi:hypothetical protein